MLTSTTAYYQETIVKSTTTTPNTTPKNQSNITGKLANMKTLQLMTKMQQEHEEKQKRRKLRRQQIEEAKLQQQQQQTNGGTSRSNNDLAKHAITPRSERKFLSSIMNTLFSGGGKEAVLNSPTHESENGNNGGGLVKNEAKRLSLKRIKAKDKAKKKGNFHKNFTKIFFFKLSKKFIKN